MGIFLMSLVSAVPPVQTTVFGGNNYEIIYPKIDYIQPNQTFTFNFHVNNISDGLLLTNSTVSCRFHLYNSSGNHILEINNIKDMDASIDFYVKVTGGNFTKIGQYGCLFSCNSSSFGGYVSFPLTVTYAKMDIPTSESILYLLLVLGILILFLVSLYFSASLPYSNEKNEKGQVNKVSYFKYIKIGMIMVSYSLFLWFLNILVAISDNFISLNIFYGLISGLFFLMLKGFFPALVITFIWIIIVGFKDANFKNMIKEFNIR
ncbi:MAG: hypothetical protein WC711_04005 [Candidatus Staskawiczbacteria bacterium]